MKPKFKVTLPIVAEPIEPFPLPIETVSTADETKAFKQWLFNYTANILPRDGGMVGAAGIGGPRMKVQAFARIMFPGKELEHLNREEQEKFKHYFDSAVKQDVNGPGTGVKGLVAIINETIGAKT